MKSDAVARASVNEAREARGLQPVNSCWLWGGAARPRRRPLAMAGGPDWMAALRHRGQRATTDRRAGPAMLADLIAPAQVGDWPTGWRACSASSRTGSRRCWPH
jgi:hypothetical protein